MITASDLLEALSQFTGTCDYFIGTGGMKYTEGVQYLAENAGAYWLLDLIWSYQPKCKADPMLAEIQFWTLKVNTATHEAVVICERDTGDIAISQAIPFTDFPLDQIKLYVQGNVVLLPSEY